MGFHCALIELVSFRMAADVEYCANEGHAFEESAAYNHEYRNTEDNHKYIDLYTY